MKNSSEQLVSASTISKRIDDIRRTKKPVITIEELASKAGISRSYLNELRSGKKRWNMDMLKAISSVLEEDVSAILSRKNPIHFPILGCISTGSNVSPYFKNAIFSSSLGDIMADALEKQRLQYIAAPTNDYENEDIGVLETENDQDYPGLPKGSKIGYLRVPQPISDFFGRLCVIETSDDFFIASPSAGISAEYFNITSPRGDIRRDVEIKNCAPVRWFVVNQV